MLIEDLVRLGTPLLKGELDDEEIIRLITDVESDRTKNFFRHVFVVYVPAKDNDVKQPIALSMQKFGNVEGKDFEVSKAQSIGVPFVLPAGGNPVKPQGTYGVPVYPCYDAHIQAMRKSVDGVADFLRGRLERTIGFQLSDAEFDRIAQVTYERISKEDFGDEKKMLGILVLAKCGEDEFYNLVKGLDSTRIGTVDNDSIVPNYKKMLEGIWLAKVEEGREKGTRTGTCSFTGVEGDLVSTYCKSWTWAFPTWTCPLPRGGDEKMMVESIALSSSAYRALTLGSCIFGKLTKPINSLILPQIFSPTTTRTEKKPGDTPTIFGSAFLLPLRDELLADSDMRYEFSKGMRGMLSREPSDQATRADRYISAVTGFDVVLPQELEGDHYRLSLVYFSGDFTRGDVHLRAFIEDVIPSTATKLRDVAKKHASDGLRILQAVFHKPSEKYLAYMAKCYQSVPYLLSRAYGGGYLWQQLEAVLHRRPLSINRATRNTAGRLRSLAPRWPDSAFDMADEVGFYLSFLQFVAQVNSQIALHKGDSEMPMRTWNELLMTYQYKPIEEMTFESPAELGFACGLLLRRFNGQYKYLFGNEKDFLKDRVLTFGASLTVRDVKRGLVTIRNVAGKYDKLRSFVELGQLAFFPKDEREKWNDQDKKGYYGDFDRRLGITLNKLQQDHESANKNADEFMTGFWSGYSLQGYNPEKQTVETEQPITQTEE